MKQIFAMVVLAAIWARTAHADAMLTGSGSPRFPTRIDIDTTVRAQIESTTIVMELAPITEGGDFALTVPAPFGATPIGVDIDQGQGWVALPVIAGAPEAGSGGSTDAALQAWQGTTPLVASLKNLQPGPLGVRVRFVRVLRRAGGQVAFEIASRRCPARESGDPGAATTVHLHLETARDLKHLEAPGANVQLSTRGGDVQTDTASGDVVVPVTYAEVATGIGAQVLVHRAPGADPMGGDAGYFMLLLDAEPAPSMMPRAISLVLDHSGSMSGDKIAQARDSARAMLGLLNPEDVFNIHIFDDDVESFATDPVAATTANIQSALDYVKHIADDGSTNLNAGLQAGLHPPSLPERFDAVVMLSDGLANTGEIDHRNIIANAWQAAGGDTRIFTFSVGRDADRSLMELLALGSRGRHVDLNNAQATRDLVIYARELFEDIRNVRLSDLDFQIDGIGVTDALPEASPDLFSGGQVLVVGRYATPGAGAISITGFEGEAAFSRTLLVDAPALAEHAEIIKYVWATEKVRALHAQIANGGDATALRAEIEAIGISYRIQTPFTHYIGDFAGDPTGGSSGGVARLPAVQLALPSGCSRSRSC